MRTKKSINEINQFDRVWLWWFEQTHSSRITVRLTSRPDCGGGVHIRHTRMVEEAIERINATTAMVIPQIVCAIVRQIHQIVIAMQLQVFHASDVCERRSRCPEMLHNFSQMTNCWLVNRIHFTDQASVIENRADRLHWRWRRTLFVDCVHHAVHRRKYVDGRQWLSIVDIKHGDVAVFRINLLSCFVHGFPVTIERSQSRGDQSDAGQINGAVHGINVIDAHTFVFVKGPHGLCATLDAAEHGRSASFARNQIVMLFPGAVLTTLITIRRRIYRAEWIFDGDNVTNHQIAIGHQMPAVFNVATNFHTVGYKRHLLMCGIAQLRFDSDRININHSCQLFVAYRLSG